MSDNGYEWGEHGLDFKGYPYDDSVRVPMYMRWPGHVVAGATDTRLVGNIDVAPTIADAVGRAPDHAADGRALDAQPGADPVPDPARVVRVQRRARLGRASGRPTSHYIEHYDLIDNQSIRFREYYDLTADPWEMNNLLGDGSAANDPNTAALSAQLAAGPRLLGRRTARRSRRRRRLTGADVAGVWLSSPAMTRIHKTSTAVLLAVAALGLGACGDDNKSSTGGDSATNDAIATNSTDTTNGTTGTGRARRARTDDRPARPAPARARATTRAAPAARAARAAAAPTTPAAPAARRLRRRRQARQLREKELTGKNVKSTAKTVCTSFLPTALRARPQERQEVRGGHREGLLAGLPDRAAQGRLRRLPRRAEDQGLERESGGPGAALLGQPGSFMLSRIAGRPVGRPSGQPGSFMLAK